MSEKKVPELRFKGFSDDWEQRKLKESSTYIRGSFPQPYTNSDFYDEENGMPFVQVSDIGFDLKLNPDTKMHISKIAEPKSRFVTAGKVVVALQGSIEKSIGRTAITQYDAYFDRTILIFQNFKIPMDKQYFAQVIKKLFEREKERAWGATISTITKEHLNDFIIGVPSIQEQRKIGTFFKQLDTTIALHQRKLRLLKRLKQGYLQKMFPKNGEKVPELRFAGFDEEWEQRKLGTEVQIIMGQSPNSENYTENPEDYILVQGNADMKNSRVVPRVWTTQVTKQAQKGDLILSVRAPVGDIGKTDYDVVIGRGVAAIRGNEFVFQQLGKMKINSYWNRYSTGSTFESINSNDIKEAIILVPSSEEQEKIGAFFKQLDTAITLHQNKINDLMSLKSSFLREMFI